MTLVISIKKVVLPVPVKSLIPWCLVQSNVSVVSWNQPQSPVSKVHVTPELDDGLVLLPVSGNIKQRYSVVFKNMRARFTSKAHVL